MRNNKVALIFTSIMALAFGLRLFFATRGSLGVYDLAFIEIAQKNLKGIIDNLGSFDHQPLFIFVLHYWMVVAKKSDFILRLLPVFFSALSLIPVYFFTKKIFTIYTVENIDKVREIFYMENPESFFTVFFDGPGIDSKIIGCFNENYSSVLENRYDGEARGFGNCLI